MVTNTKNKLAMIRKEAGLSQGQLAKSTGINVNMISKLERGERSINNTTLATCIKLADALGVSDLRDLAK